MFSKKIWRPVSVLSLYKIMSTIAFLIGFSCPIIEKNTVLEIIVSLSSLWLCFPVSFLVLASRKHFDYVSSKASEKIGECRGAPTLWYINPSILKETIWSKAICYSMPTQLYEITDNSCIYMHGFTKHWWVTEHKKHLRTLLMRLLKPTKYHAFVQNLLRFSAQKE